MRILKSSKKIWILGFLILGCLSTVLVIGAHWVNTENSYFANRVSFQKTKIPWSSRKIASAQIESLLDENMPYDLTPWTGTELAVRAKIRLVQKADLTVDEEEKVLLRLPDLLMKNRKDQTASICDSLSLVEVILEAEGFSFNGEPLFFKLITHCRVSQPDQDVSHGPGETLAPQILVWLDFNKLKKESFFKDETGFYFANGPLIPEAKTWFVRQVQFYSPEHKLDVLRLNAFEIEKIRGQSLQVSRP